MSTTVNMNIAATTGTASVVRRYEGKMDVWEITWTSTSGGAVEVKLPEIWGRVVRMVTDPAAGGSAPTDNYDVTLVDENALDVLGGTGADRDTANTEAISPGVYLAGQVTFTVANAGNAKAGVAKIYVVRE